MIELKKGKKKTQQGMRGVPLRKPQRDEAGKHPRALTCSWR